MILTIVLLASIAGPPPAATLCVADSCRAADAAEIRVAPADLPRPFVWISAGGERVIVGVIPPAAEVVPLSGERRTTHKLTLVASDGARKVQPSFSLLCGSSEWKWTQSELPRTAIEVVHPNAPCTLRVRSAGYKAVETPLSDVAVPTIYLHRLPVISGTITDATTHTPVDRAEVRSMSGERLATSDVDGRFRAVVDGPWPSQIRIEAPGRATRLISVPKAVADTHLPITLSPGGTIALVLAPPLGQEDVSWEARRVIDRWKNEVVRTGQIAAGQSTAAIEGLEAGTYRIVLKGKEPLQRFAQAAEVTDGMTTEVLMLVEPARLELEVTRAGKPFADADVEISYAEGAWRSQVSVDGDGKAVEEIWQKGRYTGGIGTWYETRELREEGPHQWTMAIPERRIRGRITDAVTRQPVPGAEVVLDASFAMTRATTAADGTFEFEMLPAGTYSLSVEAGGYQNLRTPRASLAEDARLEVRDLAMQPARGRSMRAVTGPGIPVVGAVVYVSSRHGGTRMAGLTDAQGRVLLPVQPNEQGSLFVLPQSGSLGVARFSAAIESDGDELTVIVAEGTASLEMRTETEDGDPLGGVAYVMRVDGILVPMEVKETMQKVGIPLQSDASGKVVLSRMPPGRYEIWPLANRADYLAATAPIPPPAPVNVLLTPGHHVAKLTFKRKE